MGTIRVFLLTADSADQLEALLIQPLDVLEAHKETIEIKLDTDTAEAARVSFFKQHAALKFFKTEN